MGPAATTASREEGSELACGNRRRGSNNERPRGVPKCRSICGQAVDDLLSHARVGQEMTCPSRRCGCRLPPQTMGSFVMWESTVFAAVVPMAKTHFHYTVSQAVKPFDYLQTMCYPRVTPTAPRSIKTAVRAVSAREYHSLCLTARMVQIVIRGEVHARQPVHHRCR